MLLILQRRGRTTARELAEQLEVSERTILRDIEALSEAGVPIYASQGRGGGIELLDGFQTRLTGLTVDEARSLFLVGQPLVAQHLGVGGPVRTVREKLLAAMPPAMATQAQELATWFHHDPDPWQAARPVYAELSRIAAAIEQRRLIDMRFASSKPVCSIGPLGLVLKAGSWYLVHTADFDVAASCLDDLTATRLLAARFSPPTDFNLAQAWERHCRTRGEFGCSANDGPR